MVMYTQRLSIGHLTNYPVSMPSPFHSSLLSGVCLCRTETVRHAMYVCMRIGLPLYDRRVLAAVGPTNMNRMTMTWPVHRCSLAIQATVVHLIPTFRTASTAIPPSVFEPMSAVLSDSAQSSSLDSFPATTAPTIVRHPSTAPPP